MISERQHGFYRVYLLVLAIASGLLFLAWSHVFDWMTEKNVFRHSPKTLYIAVQGGVFFFYGIFHARWDAVLLGRDRRARLMMGLRQASVMILALLVFLVGTKDIFVSRAFLFSYIPILAILMVILNDILPVLIPRLIFGGMSSEGAVLLSPDNGSGSGSPDFVRLGEWIAAQRDCGILIHGVLESEPVLSRRCQLPHLGDPPLLRHVLADTGARSLYLTQLPENQTQLAEMIALCEESAVRFSTILDLQSRVGRPVHLTSSNGMQLLVVRREPLENPVRRLAKRGFDILFSLLVLLIALPPIALVTAVMQSIQSPGPLFSASCAAAEGTLPSGFSNSGPCTRWPRVTNRGRPWPATPASTPSVHSCAGHRWTNCPSSSMCCAAR